MEVGQLKMNYNVYVTVAKTVKVPLHAEDEEAAADLAKKLVRAGFADVQKWTEQPLTTIVTEAPAYIAR